VGVSVEQIKSELAELPEEQQNQLAAYLVHLRHQRNALARKEFSGRIDDSNPTPWISPAELRDKWKD